MALMELNSVIPPPIDEDSYDEMRGWDVEKEKLLIQWTDKSACYKWLHEKSHQHYKRVNTWFTIPVIILSTVGGVGNFGLERFSSENQKWITITIGTISIIAGIITTISQFLKIAEINEAHKKSSLDWGKFHRDIQLIISNKPQQRGIANSQMNTLKELYDRYMESAPPIEDMIVNRFNTTFTDTNLVKPEICGHLKSAETMNSVSFYNKRRDDIDMGLSHDVATRINRVEVTVAE